LLICLKFTISQHIRDKQLLESFINYFNCGYLNSDSNGVLFIVTKFSDINEKIIPFFDKYSINGTKSLDFEDLKKTA